MTRLLKQENH